MTWLGSGIDKDLVTLTTKSTLLLCGNPTRFKPLRLAHGINEVMSSTMIATPANHSPPLLRFPTELHDEIFFYVFDTKTRAIFSLASTAPGARRTTSDLPRP
ncbi:hypothetical protein B0A48_09171 [Cryoendolithus antarcticus]|uniref:Uncharacterized protein n=1 Tax=Cryoendolithus antarcticus TaxID=1507870 RepID=A0A1V8T1U1_9PEZI|nr:hypothetical protein B0A48_09171 [Cryoendolithus antarcticus]